MASASPELATLATLLPLSALFLLWGYCNFKYGWSEAFSSGQVQVAPVMDNDAISREQQVYHQPTNMSSMTVTISLEQRMQILELIFPAPPTTTTTTTQEGNNEENDNNRVTIARRLVYTYDVESKQYVGHPNDSLGVASPSCSICLEDFGTLQGGGWWWWYHDALFFLSCRIIIIVLYCIVLCCVVGASVAESFSSETNSSPLIPMRHAYHTWTHTFFGNFISWQQQQQQKLRHALWLAGVSIPITDIAFWIGSRWITTIVPIAVPTCGIHKSFNAWKNNCNIKRNRTNAEYLNVCWETETVVCAGRTSPAFLRDLYN